MKDRIRDKDGNIVYIATTMNAKGEVVFTTTLDPLKHLMERENEGRNIGKDGIGEA